MNKPLERRLIRDVVNVELIFSMRGCRYLDNHIYWSGFHFFFFLRDTVFKCKNKWK